MWWCFDVPPVRGMFCLNICSLNSPDCSPMNYHVCGVIGQVTKRSASITKSKLIDRIATDLDKLICQITKSLRNHYGCWGWFLWSNSLCIVVVFMPRIPFSIKIYFRLSQVTMKFIPNALQFAMNTWKCLLAFIHLIKIYSKNRKLKYPRNSISRKDKKIQKISSYF